MRVDIINDLHSFYDKWVINARAVVLAFLIIIVVLFRIIIYLLIDLIRRVSFQQFGLQSIDNSLAVFHLHKILLVILAHLRIILIDELNELLLFDLILLPLLFLLIHNQIILFLLSFLFLLSLPFLLFIQFLLLISFFIHISCCCLLFA